LTTSIKWFIIVLTDKDNNASEGGREYREGKQEYHITPGNRIREIEMPHKPLDA